MSEIYVGKTPDGFGLVLKSEQRVEHVQIIASTGRGKTQSVILPWLVQDFVRGSNVILIDGKGDQGLVTKIRHFAKSPGDVIVFDLGDLGNSAVTNPIKYGSPQQIADRMFATFEFESHYFETVSYEAALLVLELFRSQGREAKFRDLYRCLTDDAVLTDLVSGTCREARSSDDEGTTLALKYLAEPFRSRQEKLSGFLGQLRPFAMGELAELVNGDSGMRRSFSLSELVREPSRGSNRALVILIPALLYQKSAARLGQMFLQEMAWAAASRKTNEFLPVFLDEFSSFVYEGFLQLLNKARSMGIALHLSHQSMGDLEKISPDFAKAIVTNTNVKCVLGVNDPETAEFFAKLFGTEKAKKTTERAEKKFLSEMEMSGFMSVRDVEQYRIHPNRLKTFSRGQGVLSFMSDGESIVEEIQFARVPGGV